MCGRTCLTLQPDDILCACKYKNAKVPKNDEESHKNKPDSNIKFKKEETISENENVSKTVLIKEEPLDLENENEKLITPEWRAEFNCGRTFLPSYNIAPTDITPVIVSADHFNETSDNANKTRVVMPMMWGMIPFWHKGDYRRHGLTTNNCRLEHMLDSKLYSGPFRRGQRCVVLCEGFYEWQTTKTAKPSERAAHLIYMPQSEGVKIYDKSTWAAEDVKLLKMAALFDVWTDENGDKIYSYSIITFESTKIMSWMHHRMPAILETEKQVNDWLDFKHVTNKQALEAIRSPAESIQWHRVANVVNNSRNKSPHCNKPYEIIPTKGNESTNSKTPKNKTLLSWLNVRKRREASLDNTDDDSDCINDESETGTPAKRGKFRDFKNETNSTLNNNDCIGDTNSTNCNEQ